MPPKAAGERTADVKVPKLTRRPSTNTSTNGVENPIDPDAPREGRLASLKTRGVPPTRGTGPKITFKPKAVQRRRRDGASESLLSASQSEDNAGPSDSRLRRAERGRGTGRGRGGSRPDIPLVASGPFAQGPAQAPNAGPPGRGSSRSMTGGRLDTQTSSGRSTTAKREKLSKAEMEEEANLDDTGKPMQNLLRMQDDTSDFWAPITTERIERAPKEAALMLPGQQLKTVRIKKEAEDLGFIDVKAEPTESTITSAMPTPEPQADDTNMADAGNEPADQANPAHVADDDEDDIMLPGMQQNALPADSDKKARPEKDKKKEVIRVMTAEEAEEQERLSADLESLRMNFSRTAGDISYHGEELIFIQLPEVLPYWNPGPEDDKDDGFFKEEEEKTEVVEIDQKAEDRKPDMATDQASGATQGHTSENKSSETAPNDSTRHPDTASSTPLPKKKKKKQKPIMFPPPEGCLGQLNIHRSGKITCHWGGIKMDVGAGSECGFLQEVVAIDNKTDKTAWSLGQVSSRMLLTPDLDDLLEPGT